MLLSLKDDDDDDNGVEEYSDSSYDDDIDKAEDKTHNNGHLLEGVQTMNANTDSAMQQTVLAFEEQDFFGSHNNHLLTESFTHNSHIHSQRATNANVNQQSANVATTAQAKTTSSLLNTHNSSISPSTSPSVDVKTNVDDIIESKTSNSKPQPYNSSSNSPRSNGKSLTNSPASRRQQQQQLLTPRLFSSNILPAHLRQESYNTHDDTDEICLVPEVDFECSSIMDHSTDNRESQPLLGGGPSGSAGSRDHFDAVCNTFTGKFIVIITFIIEIFCVIQNRFFVFI